MSAASVNCRGLGNHATVRELRDFVKKYAPTILCVVETQLHKVSVEKFAPTLGFDKAFAVSRSGRKEGIGMFWNHNLKVEILPYSQYHLDAVIQEEGGDPWRFTCVYGDAQTN